MDEALERPTGLSLLQARIAKLRYSEACPLPEPSMLTLALTTIALCIQRVGSKDTKDAK